MNSAESGGWETIEKVQRGKKVPKPTVAVDGDSQQIAVLATAFEKLGKPEQIRYLMDGGRVAIVPAEPDEKNTYPDYSSSGAGGQFAFGWAANHIDGIDETTNGRAPLHYDDETGVWFFNADEIGEGENR